jgi:hypothetical protein
MNTNDGNAAHRKKQERVIGICRRVAKELLTDEPLPSRIKIQELLMHAKTLGLEEEPWVRVVATDVLNASS